MTLWQRIKFVSSEMGKWLWPFIKMYMSAFAPVVAAAATQAIAVVAEYGLTNDDDKKREAFRLIEADLKRQGIVIGVQVTTNMVNGAIVAAVQNTKPK